MNYNDFMTHTKKLFNQLSIKCLNYEHESYPTFLNNFINHINTIEEKKEQVNIDDIINIMFDVIISNCWFQYSSFNHREIKYLFNQRITQSISTFQKKNQEYVSKYNNTTEPDILENFKMPKLYNINISPENVLIGYLRKHFMSIIQILTYIEKHVKDDEWMSSFIPDNNDIIQEKLGDIFIYMMIFNGLINDKK